MPDIIRNWLTTAGSYALLTKEEEQSLAIAIQAGLAFNASDTEKRSGLRAQDKLIRHNLRLVISISKNYSNKYSSLAFEDLIQEGNYGLQVAVMRFKPEYGYKLSTYATWWIRQAIQRYVDNNKTTIRLPLHCQESRRKIQKAVRKIAISGEEVTTQKIAEICQFSPKKIAKVFKASQISQTCSFNKPIKKSNSSDEIEWIDYLGRCDRAITEYEQLETAIALLEEKHQTVIIKRFGLDGSAPRTLYQVGQEMGGISKERARQIQKEAFKQIKDTFPHLKDLLEA